MRWTNQRTQLRDTSTPKTPSTLEATSTQTKKLSPFMETMDTLMDSTNDNTDTDTTLHKSPNLLPDHIPVSTPKQDNTTDDHASTQSIHSDITQQAADLEKKMNIVMETVKGSEPEDKNVDHITPIVTTILQTN